MPSLKVVKRRPQKSPQLRDLVLDAVAVELGNDGAPPKRLRIAAFGENPTSNGTFVLRKEDAKAMVERYQRRGIKAHSDYEHSSHKASEKGGEAPASSWYDLELGNDGLYAANVEWTPPALERLKNREYRYISPWFGQRQDGSVATFKNFALTNRPAMDNLPALVASDDDASEDEATTPEKPKMDPTLLKMLMLSEDATEAQVAARISALNTERDAIFTATGAKDVPGALAAIELAKRDAASAKALQAKLDELTKGSEKKERDAILSEAVTSGAIPPNMKDFWASESMTLDQLKAYVEKVGKPAAKVPGVKEPKEKGQQEVDLTLSEEDKATCKILSISEEEFAKQKKLTLGRA